MNVPVAANRPTGGASGEAGGKRATPSTKQRIALGRASHYSGSGRDILGAQFGEGFLEVMELVADVGSCIYRFEFPGQGRGAFGGGLDVATVRGAS